MLNRNAGSFRDPSGTVYEDDNAVFRSIAAHAAPEYEAARDAGVLQTLVDSGRLVAFEEVQPAMLSGAGDDVSYLLRHPRIPYISYPYEWSFSLLHEAALFHLDLHLWLLARGFSLSDASAYNVQYLGPKPIFIDHLSIRRYREGEFWTGHRQFCEQFLNPLLLQALRGVPHNAWYRGQLEGLPMADLAKLLRIRDRLSWRVFTHVVLQNRFQQSASHRENIEHKLDQQRLPLAGYQAMLKQLRRWIAALKPKRKGVTTWGDYAANNSYAAAEAMEKERFIRDVVTEMRPRLMFDLGCNNGAYAKAALESGAGRVIGFDFDQQALDSAHHRAQAESLNFLPLFLDARNPSPDQGWLQAERPGHAARAKADMVLALAFEHHLAIAHNVPLDQVITWIVDLAPAGVIEFVPKSDPTIGRMLALREDIFVNYDLERFATILGKRATIRQRKTVSESGRTLFWYTR